VGQVLTFAELKALAAAEKKPPVPSVARRPRGAGATSR